MQNPGRRKINPGSRENDDGGTSHALAEASFPQHFSQRERGKRDPGKGVIK